MADTFLNYEKQCKDTQGHIKRIYVLPFVFYNETLIKSTGMYLTTFPESTVYRFDCWGNYSQSTTTEKGNVQWSHSVEVNLPKVYEVYDINIFYRNDFRIIVETNNGHLIMFGTNNGLQCEISNNSGNSKTEFNGFTLTFTGIEEKPGLLISTLGTFFNVFVELIDVNYGYLYNHPTIKDSRNFAPIGWRLMTFAEGEDFITYLGGTTVGGGKIKETGTTHWTTPNTGATNEYLFNGRGAGQRLSDGTFNNLNESLNIWTEDYSVDYPRQRISVFYNSDDISHGDINEGYASSARFRKDSTSLSAGETSYVIGNDGKAYPTICINGVEYMACNSCETKYQNGDSIPEITDNTEWSNSIIGVRCSYNNLESNAINS